MWFDFDELGATEGSEEERLDEAPPEQLVFYDYWSSSCAWRVRLALAYKGIPYETRAGILDVRKSLNPMRQVPFISALGWQEPLSQSVAICLYLDEVCNGPPLLPRSGRRRAALLEMVELINSFVQPTQATSMARGLAALEKLASRWLCGASSSDKVHSSRGLFLGGGVEPSLADFFLVPQLGNARCSKITLDAYPTLLQAEAQLRSHPVYEQAHPRVAVAAGATDESGLQSAEFETRWPDM
eukprot:gnl/TRDRNA2_/TRDRNA2_147418_c1_seq1.p1 gnl/TRDRNA2_/TRDRNA2_147418_c1~~gnl/TRDRNA2_/TRDRNA2_147418_c1_seq1.p1  ORF type:complete len:242 (+),score=33.40 gnl/TRDRNA2_/TRDRNA2_147418_c1_seq1:55-780(+)